MRLAYGDPPYPGCAHLYKGHQDYAGEVDHVALARTLDEYDGWILHTNSTTLPFVYDCLREAGVTDFRTMAWVKTFAAFKPNVPVAYAWEPCLVKAARKPVVTEALVMRDWIAEPITMMRGLPGVKPDAVCRWAFHVMGADPDEDTLDDLFPGTGAVGRAWASWCNERPLDLGGAG